MSEPNKPDKDVLNTDKMIKKAEAQLNAMFEAANKKIEDMISGAEERAEEIVNSARKTEKTEKTGNPVREIKQEPRVKVKLKKDKEKNNTDLPVSVNGKTWLIQRGVWVDVPLSVAEVLENADRQEEFAIEYSEGLSAAFEEKLNKL